MPNAVAELSNGDLLTIAGSVIAEFSPSGTLRPAVTGGTIAATSSGGTNVFQSDGRFLLAQAALGPGGVRGTDIRVFRFALGVDWAFVNPSFGFGTNTADSATAIVLQRDLRILVGGTSSPDSSSESLGLARLSPDGSLDLTFGSGGRVTTAFSGAFVGVSALTLQSDGKIVAAGQALRNSTGAVNLVLARYLP